MELQKLFLPHYNLFGHHRDLTHRFLATSDSFNLKVQQDCYQTNFIIEKIDWIGKYKTIIGFIPLSWLEVFGYPIYQVEFYLKKGGKRNV